MKYSTAIRTGSAFCMLALIAGAFAQDQWVRQSPLPSELDLNSVQFLNANVGYAVGDEGTIVKSTDGGETWNSQSSGVKWALTSVSFADTNTGYAVGGFSALVKTVDGGATWTSLNGPDDYQPHVYFTSATVGYIVGSKGKIYKTVNGGTTWATLTTGTTNQISAVYFKNADTGYAVGGGIFKTVDGGSTWSAKGQNMGGVTVCFPTADTGYVASGSSIFKTVDGGATWTNTSKTISALVSILSLHFSNTDIGYAAGGGSLFKTINGGSTWTEQTSTSSGSPTRSINLKSIHAIDANTAYAVAAAGRIIKTVNGGATWTAQTKGTTNSLSGIHFPVPDTGYAVGGDGVIMKTVDRGASWIAQYLGFDSFKAVFFVNAKIGFAVGASGSIRKTTNGGQSWSVISIDPTYSHFNSVFFTDENTGYGVGFSSGSGGIIYKTIDGGANWNSLNSGVTNIGLGWASVFFTNATTGYVVGSTGNGVAVILKTVNAGANWAAQNFSTHMRSVHFPDAKTGYAVGGPTILKTEDAGETWKAQTGADGKDLHAVRFADAKTGYAVGWQGVILRTVNGGSNWIPQPVKTNKYLYALEIVDGNTVYVGGHSGVLHKYTYTNPSPSLATPADKSEIQTLNPTITWGSTNSASSYHLQISTSADFATTIKEDSTLTVTTLPIGPLAAGTQYYWRVRAKSIGQPSPWSSIWSFKTALATSLTSMGVGFPKNLELELKANGGGTWSLMLGIPKSGRVEIKVVSLANGSSFSMMDKELIAGFHELEWDGKLSHGLYAVTVKSGENTLSRKMAILH